MIEISNIRLEEMGEWTRLIVDISSDFQRTENESTMWLAVKKEYADVFTTDVYNAFLFLPMYMSMYYHSPLHIKGNVSKMLYRNVVDYLQQFMCTFSDSLLKTDIIVDGFGEAKGTRSIVGTGISCGVDCLSTIHKYFVKENDSEYKINTLFMFNCGWHGDYYSAKTKEVFQERCKMNKAAADEMGLRFIEVDSNLHAFLPQLDDQASYFCLYTSVFAMENAIAKYYISSSYGYGEVMEYGYKSRNRDFSEYGDPIAIPLMQSEGLRIISDGCQYQRPQKVEQIIDWDISKKYLNVCCINDSGENCSMCTKCVRTLLAIEALGKLDEYSAVFDIERYKSKAKQSKYNIVKGRKKDVFHKENYEFMKAHGIELPSDLSAQMYFLPRSVRNRLRRLKDKLMKSN